MKLGAHLGIARGLKWTAAEAVRLRCECVQIFVSNPRGWRRGTAPAEDEVEALRRTLERHCIAPLICHSSYLVNLASSDPVLWRRSLDCAGADLRRAAGLGSDRFVVSGGSFRGGTEAQGKRRLARALRQLARVAPGVAVLVENTAGAGSSLCWRFEQLAAVFADAGDAPALGVCLDTCHAHVAGYDLAGVESVGAMLERFDRTVGLARLRAVHLNDARFPAGSHRDAHAHIGRGTIGAQGFRALLGWPSLTDTPAVIETPKEAAADVRNLRLLRRLRAEAARPQTGQQRR